MHYVDVSRGELKLKEAIGIPYYDATRKHIRDVLAKLTAQFGLDRAVSHNCPQFDDVGRPPVNVPRFGAAVNHEVAIRPNGEAFLFAFYKTTSYPIIKLNEVERMAELARSENKFT